MKTGNTCTSSGTFSQPDTPQWSPVMKTGNTTRRRGILPRQLHASMEPGHEDREYPQHVVEDRGVEQASMEPGHEDREYPNSPRRSTPSAGCLNGARS